jgi:hypothetical protein
VVVSLRRIERHLGIGIHWPIHSPRPREIFAFRIYVYVPVVCGVWCDFVIATTLRAAMDAWAQRVTQNQRMELSVVLWNDPQ